MTPRPDSPPARLRLRAGVGVVVRETGVVQVGLDPQRCVLVRPTPEATAFVRALARRATPLPTSPPLREIADALLDRGLAVGDQAHRRVRSARASTTVRVLGQPEWSHELADLLVAAGLRPVGAEDGTGDVTVHLGCGEPDRDAVDLLSHAGDPVLFVSLVDVRLRVGPFVVPGVTACLRCLDAHGASLDPAPSRLPAIAVPLPDPDLSPTLLTAGLARAVADVSAWAARGRPSTWSALVWIDESLEVQRDEWLRHPHCGCSWGDLLVAR